MKATTQKNTAYAYLSIDEFSCSIEELTQRIGLQPTEAWQAGDTVPPVRFPRKVLQSRRQKGRKTISV